MLVRMGVLLTVFSWISIWAPMASAGCVTGVSPNSGLNVRSGPSTGYAVRGQIPADACGVRVTNRCRRNWCRVRYKRLRGWAIMKFIDRDRAAVGQPQESSETSGAWELLGARSVDFVRDRDTIPVGRAEGRYNAIQVVVQDRPIYLRYVEITFGNGARQRLAINSRFRADQRTAVLDLQGRQRVVRSVEIVYRIPKRNRGNAEVLVFGRHGRSAARKRAARQPVDTLYWQRLGSRSVLYGGDTDVIPIGARIGRFRAIQLAVRNSALRLETLRVIYGNGRADTIAVRQRIFKGGTTRVIDLRGNARVIKEIQMTYQSVGPRNVAARVEVYGLR